MALHTRIHPESFGPSWAGGVNPLSRASAGDVFAPAPLRAQDPPTSSASAAAAGTSSLHAPPLRPHLPSFSTSSTHSSSTTTSTATSTTTTSGATSEEEDEEDDMRTRSSTPDPLSVYSPPPASSPSPSPLLSPCFSPSPTFSPSPSPPPSPSPSPQLPSRTRLSKKAGGSSRRTSSQHQQQQQPQHSYPHHAEPPRHSSHHHKRSTSSRHTAIPEDLHIARLRQAISSIDHQLASLTLEREDLQAQLDYATRRQAPVHRLPAELLSSIFVMGVLGGTGGPFVGSDDLTAEEDDRQDEEGEVEDNVMVPVLMLVCRQWRNVALDTPELWARISISSHDTLAKARHRLMRSKSAPLDVSVRFDGDHTSFGYTSRQTSSAPGHQLPLPEAVQRAMDTVCPSLWRTRSLSLTVPTRALAAKALSRCQNEGAPILESLEIRVRHEMLDDHDYDNGGGGGFYHQYHQQYTSSTSSSTSTSSSALGIVLFANDTPLLRRVSLSSFNLGWTSPVVTNLRVLELSGYFNAYAPSVDAVLGVLRGCPELQELSLRNMSDVDMAGCHSPFSDAEDGEHPFFSSFSMSSQDTPSSSPSALSSSPRYAFLSNLPPKSVHLPRLTKLSFNNSGLLRTLLLLAQIQLPALRCLELSFLQNITPVLDVLYEASLTRLPLRVLRIESSWFNGAKFLALLRKIGSLVELALVDVEDMNGVIMKTLSSSRPWIIPRLESLTLDGCTSVPWEGLRTFVEVRLPSDTTPRSAASLPHANHPSKSARRTRKRPGLGSRPHSRSGNRKRISTGNASSSSSPSRASKLRNRGAGHGSGTGTGVSSASAFAKAADKAARVSSSSASAAAGGKPQAMSSASAAAAISGIRPSTSSASAFAERTTSASGTYSYPSIPPAPLSQTYYNSTSTNTSSSIQGFSNTTSMTSALGPKRLTYLDVTRCHQISREMVQWFRMYVDEVACDQFSKPGHWSGRSGSSASSSS